MFHGRINEPIPPWSRLYHGSWFQKQLEAGYTLSSETQKRAEAMFQAAYKDPSSEPTEKMEEPPKKKFVIKKPVVEPKPTPKARAKPKAKTNPPTPGFVSGTLEEEVTVKNIPVKKTEIDGRSVYLNSSNHRVYDLKFTYIGHFNRDKNCIDPHLSHLPEE